MLGTPQDCTVGPVTRLHLHEGFLEGSQWELSAGPSTCTALQASLWKQLARDKDLATQVGARAAPPSHRQVVFTAADSNVHLCFTV